MFLMELSMVEYCLLCFFNIYMNDLRIQLNDSGVGCNINSTFFKSFDIC